MQFIMLRNKKYVAKLFRTLTAGSNDFQMRKNVKFPIPPLGSHVGSDV